MPFLIRRPRAVRLLCALVGAFAFAGSVPAMASACSVQTSGTSTAFSQYGDNSQYTLAPGGSFNNGAPGWSLNDAWLSGANDQFSGTLTIAPQGVATSAEFCVSSETPTFRFYARQTSGNWAEVNVFVIWTNASGQTEVTCAGGLTLSPNWAPSGIYPLGNMLPTESGGTFDVRIEFVANYVPNSSTGNAAVTDLYVDPYSRS